MRVANSWTAWRRVEGLVLFGLGLSLGVSGASRVTHAEADRANDAEEQLRGYRSSRRSHVRAEPELRLGR